MNTDQNIEVQIVKSEEDIQRVATLASEIWHEYFPFILKEEQINYMVEKFQSAHAIKDQFEDGYEYYKIIADNNLVGYFSIRKDKEDKTLFLSKLYIHKSSRGRGYGTYVFDFIKGYSLERSLSKIWLTVNKYNESTINAYIKKGFYISDTRVLDIGAGYIMDDYIMEWEL
ncbi:MAG: GNAT family N-acetyltransferase [Anaerocolumna sp.]